MAKDYMGMLDIIENYYGYKSPQWNEIFKDGITPSKIYETLDTIPNVSTIKNKKGEVLFYKMKYEEVLQGVNIGSNSNSNTQLPVTSPINKTTINAPISTTINNGKVTLGNGLKSTGKFVMNTVAPAVTAASVGISLGKKIDELLYNINPDFWDEHGMSTLNPDTWSSITSGDDSLGASLFNMVFGINSDTNETQAYLDENAYAYMALYLQNQGVFSSSYSTSGTLNHNGHMYTDFQRYDRKYDFDNGRLGGNWVLGTDVIPLYYNNKLNFEKCDYFVANAKAFPTWEQYTEGNLQYLEAVIVSKTPFKLGYAPNSECIKYTFTDNVYIKAYNKDLAKWEKITLSTEPLKNFLGQDYFYYDYAQYKSTTNIYHDPSKVNGFDKTKDANWNSVNMFIESFLLMSYKENVVEGFLNQDNATLPQLLSEDTVEQTLTKLKEQYPQLWENAVTNEVVQPDGTIKEYIYIPVPMPELDSQGRPISTTQNQANTSIKPETSTQDQIQTIIDIISPTPPDNISDAPNTGEGSTPPVVLPSGSANALYSIYNPSQEELNQFGSWLWSNNFVDQLLKMFNNPMEAIIGLHKVYGAPLISGRGNIKVGYLDAGVETNLVANQYVTIDCGFVDIPEYFGNVFDYEPYTKISLYLPFIGIVPLNTADVTRATLIVKYNIDVLTGACMAEVGVIRDGVGGILYSYSGNCSVQYPLSSGSYMGIVGGVLGVAGSLIGTALTGGAMLPAVAMAGASATHMRSSVSQSGSLSGNSGAMGIKKPYVIITRPQTALADNFNKFDGYPANHYTRLSNCTGFTKVESCHVENISCTDYEREEIEKLLKNGVIV